MTEYRPTAVAMGVSMVLRQWHRDAQIARAIARQGDRTPTRTRKYLARAQAEASRPTEGET